MKCNFAEEHILKTNFAIGGVLGHQGLIVHIMDGTLIGTDSWFHNPHSQASSHFGVGKNGRLIQWVDTDNKAWTEVSGNPYWVSVECEGVGGDSLTVEQIATIGKLYEWLESQYHFGFANTASVTGKGLGHHSMGGSQWGGHYFCPGEKVIAQKPAILAKALLIRHGVTA